jgi:precorrin-3B methylase
LFTVRVVRYKAVLRRAAEGAIVAVVSSGDAGVYGMAGLVIEQADALGFEDFSWLVRESCTPRLDAAGA